MLYFQITLLVALILGTSLPFTQAGPFGINVESSVCCKSFVPFSVPLMVLKDFYKTSNTCHKEGVILITKKDREICADPRKAWVKHALVVLKRKP